MIQTQAKHWISDKKQVKYNIDHKSALKLNKAPINIQEINKHKNQLKRHNPEFPENYLRSHNIKSKSDIYWLSV